MTDPKLTVTPGDEHLRESVLQSSHDGPEQLLGLHHQTMSFTLTNSYGELEIMFLK